MRITLSFLALVIFVTPAASQVVINEFFTGTPDFIELRNCTMVPIDISGWIVGSFYATGTGAAPTPETSFTLPSGTILAPNGYLILEEFGTAGSPGTLPNSIAVGFNYFWVASRTVGAWITDNTGTGFDYVYRNVFNNGAAPLLPPGTNWTGSLTSGTGDSVARAIDADTDDASDWAITSAAGTPNALNPGQAGNPCIPGPPQYQVNAAGSSLDLDGQQASPYSPAIITRNIMTNVTANAASINVGLPFDVGISLAPLVSRSAGAFVTSNGQLVNLNTALPIVFFNGGAAPGLGTLFPGNFSQTFGTGVGTFSAALQMFNVNPAHPDGAELSQGCQLDVTADPSLTPGNATCLMPGNVLALTDDSFSQQPLGFTFTFYGVGYTDVFVGSNGHCTFGSGLSGWASSPTSLNSGPPMIALCSEDFNPGSGGQVSFFTDNVGIFEVCYTNVPSFGTTNSNTFKLLAAAGTTITFDYDPAMAENEGTIGLSAGGNINALFPMNLSVSGGVNGPATIPTGSTPHEEFTATTNPLDLLGFQINWILDPTGTAFATL